MIARTGLYPVGSIWYILSMTVKFNKDNLPQMGDIVCTDCDSWAKHIYWRVIDVYQAPRPPLNRNTDSGWAMAVEVADSSQIEKLEANQQRAVNNFYVGTKNQFDVGWFWLIDRLELIVDTRDRLSLINE